MLPVSSESLSHSEPASCRIAPPERPELPEIVVPWIRRSPPAPIAPPSLSAELLPTFVFASEAPFCPRTGATSEDDGYLVTFTIDMNDDRSECLILDARAIDKGPIARVRLPMRISSGTHATWAPQSSLRASARS